MIYKIIEIIKDEKTCLTIGGTQQVPSYGSIIRLFKEDGHIIIGTFMKSCSSRGTRTEDEDSETWSQNLMGLRFAENMRPGGGAVKYGSEI